MSRRQMDRSFSLALACLGFATSLYKALWAFGGVGGESKAKCCRGIQLGFRRPGHFWAMDSPHTRSANTFWPWHILALDSLDTEANLVTKQGAVLSRVHPVDGYPDD